MRPLVSILVPCHNAEKYLAQALESALAQSVGRKEIIVVDDGSTDGSAEVATGFKNEGVRLEIQENRGASAARNRALQLSSGTFVKFLDADDIIHPDMIRRQLTRLNGSANEVASAEWGRFYNNDISSFRRNVESIWRDVDASEWLVQAWTNARPMMQSAIFLIPRALLDRVGGWNERLSLIDDFEFFARVLCGASSVLFAPGAPFFYRSGVAGTLSGRQSRTAVESACESLLIGTGHLIARREDEKAKRACANMLQDFIYSYYPDYPDLRMRVQRRVVELGGSDLEPDGPPRFQRLRKLTGWKMARRIQRFAGH